MFRADGDEEQGDDKRPNGDDDKAADARERGWRVEHMRGQHLHQLVDPDAVAAMIRKMG
jgi:hypothetical protein